MIRSGGYHPGTLTGQSTSLLRVAAVQLNATPDVARNLEHADRHTRAAVADGAKLVVLPEKWNVLGEGKDLQAGAEPLDGAAVTWARAIAAELRIDLIAGSVSERPAEGRLRNTSLHIGPDGQIHAEYRKIHMFDVTVDGTEYKESAHEEPGEDVVLTQTSGGVEVGLSICYDVRFPELYRILAVQGARILTVPAAFTVATTRDHWEVLLRARAIENQAFVIAANQIGPHAGPLKSGGRSMIIDPWGVVQAIAPDREGHIVADLDLDAQAKLRAELPSLANRRPAAYRWPEEARV